MNYLSNPGNRLVRQNMKLEKLDSGKVYMPHLNPNFPDPIARAWVGANFMVGALLGAEKARLLADSYRDFNVGAAALTTYNMGHVMAHQFVHGANMKPVQGLEDINVHAEHTLLSRIDNQTEKGESARVNVLAVVGDIQPDQQSGEVTRTLHPCGVCREQFENPVSPIDESTLFVTANKEMTTIEWFDLEALGKLHDTGDNSGIESAEFSERSLMLTVPEWYLKGQERGLIIPPFEDSPAERAAEDEFDAKVRDPILHYLAKRALTRIEANGV
jgi:cytidine deaminase